MINIGDIFMFSPSVIRDLHLNSADPGIEDSGIIVERRDFGWVTIAKNGAYNIGFSEDILAKYGKIIPKKDLILYSYWKIKYPRFWELLNELERKR
jgi:hypothetical protein